MPNTPILNIPQVTASQNTKEVTINDAIIALEAATNANLVVDFTGAVADTVTLSGTQATRNFIFRAQNASASSTLQFPITVNGLSLNRLFSVRNESGQQITVKFVSGAGSTVIIPNGETRLIMALDGLNMIVAAQPATVATFLSLTDTPSTYATFAGKALAVNVGETALEFIDVLSFPSFVSNAGKVLAVNAGASGVEWVEVSTTFLELSDTPSSFTGAAGKLAAVNDTETGLEFIDLPAAEAVEYPTATRWRLRVTMGGAEDQVGFTEIQFRDIDGINLVGSGTAAASSFDVGKEASQSFDGTLTSGNGWLSEVDDVVGATIEYNFGTATPVRSVRIWPSDPLVAEYTPTEFVIERWNGTTWVSAGTRTPVTWVAGTPQTFAVNGSPLSSVSDAPVDGVSYLRKDAAWVSSSTLDEQIRDIISIALTQGTGIEITVNDAEDSITIAVDTTSEAERARDTIAAMLVEGTNITLTYDDTANTLTIDAGGGGGSGVPAGGTTGQVLTKQSSTDGDAEWEDLSSLARARAVPTVRGSNIQSSSASSYTATWPAGTEAGDRVIIFGGSGVAFGAVPAGWTQVDSQSGSWWNGLVITRVLTPDDITAGSVTVSLSGTFNSVIAVVALVGAPRIREVFSSRNPTGAATRTLALDGSASTEHLVLAFGSNRNASTNTVDVGTGLQSINATAASGVVKAANLGPGASAVFSYSVSSGSTGDYQILVAFEFPEVVTVGGAAYSPVTTVVGTTVDLAASDAGKYLRFTATSAKTLTVRPNATEPLAVDSEYHIRNVGTGDLTITEGSGVTVTPPSGGTLAIPPGGTVTLKRVATDEFDLLGQTVPL